MADSGRWRENAVRAATLLMLLQLAAAPALAAAVPTRDQNPLLAGFGLPLPMPARLGAPHEWTVAADINWSSTALLQNEGDEALIVDAETREVRFTFGRALGANLALQLQLPYRYTGAGTLDHFIDDWHDTFSLPEGARTYFPADQFRIAYARDATPLLDIDASASGIGDIRTDIGYRLHETPRAAATAWLSIEFPTGDARKLTGNGAVDASLIVAGEYRFAPRWSLFGQAGVTRLGDGELLAAQQRSVVWSGLAGASWRVWRGLELTAQLEAHTAAFDDTRLDFLGDSAILTVGGSYLFASGWQLDAGVSEDIAVETSPDVVLVIGIRKTGR